MLEEYSDSQTLFLTPQWLSPFSEEGIGLPKKKICSGISITMHFLANPIRQMIVSGLRGTRGLSSWLQTREESDQISNDCQMWSSWIPQSAEALSLFSRQKGVGGRKWKDLKKNDKRILQLMTHIDHPSINLKIIKPHPFVTFPFSWLVPHPKCEETACKCILEKSLTWKIKTKISKQIKVTLREIDYAGKTNKSLKVSPNTFNS